MIKCETISRRKQTIWLILQQWTKNKDEKTTTSGNIWNIGLYHILSSQSINHVPQAINVNQ